MSDVYTAEDDGLEIADIGLWALEKHRLVSMYADVFCISMKGKWNELVYLDLFAGPGYGRIRGTDRVVLTSCLRALKRHTQFSRFIFSDRSEINTVALGERAQRDFSDKDFRIKNIDVNKAVGQILDEMPRFSANYTVLALCFLDPFNMSNLRFDTIKTLSSRRMDFLVLIPSGSAPRNEDRFMNPTSKVVEYFCGASDWRGRWLDEKSKGGNFELFIVKEFTRSMEQIGYLNPGIENMKLVRTNDRNLGLYRLALFSKHTLGPEFWKQAEKYSDPQRNLFRN